MPDQKYVKNIESTFEEAKYPGNSETEKREQQENKQNKNKVIKGEVVKPRKSFGDKIKESFFRSPDDGQSVSSFAIGEVIIPTIKDMLWTVVSGSLEMLLFGEVRNSKTRRSNGGRNDNYTPYNTYYSSNPAGISGNGKRKTNVNRGNVDDPILQSREDAISVLDYLADRIQDYGFASVSDLCEALDVESNYVDLNWGWTNVSTAEIHRVREGWCLSLPKVEARDK